MSDADQPVPEPAPVRRSWRRAGGVLVAVVALLAIGAAGVAVGRVTAPGPVIVVAPAPVVEQPPAVDALPSGNGQPLGVVASPEPVSAGVPVLVANPAAVAAWPAVFTPAADLPNTGGTASGFRLSRAGIDPAQVAAALASVFGVPGGVASTNGGFTVGAADGAAAGLVVSDDPLVSWEFSDPAAGVAGKTVARDRALKLSSALLSDIGVDVNSVDWQVDRYADRTAVTAWQLAAGARTSLSWRVDFGPGDAVLRASGFSAGLEEVPGYTVVGAETAVRRASLPTWAAIGPHPLFGEPAPDAVAAATPTPTPTPTPAAVVGGAPPVLRVPMSGITVTGAELGLAQFWQPDGGLLILPSYLLTGDDGSRWSLIGVTSDFVRFVDQPYPTVKPLAP